MLLIVKDLKVWFPVRTGVFTGLLGGEKKYVHAVDGISFDVKSREVFSLVGESGSGKTTTGLAIVGIVRPTSGRILFRGIDVHNADKRARSEIRRKIQMIFQDPYESLPPHMTVFDIIGEGVDIHKLASTPDEKVDMIAKALQNVGLTPPESFFDKYPHQLSGGQRQRVAVASTLVLQPELIVADEPVSMIDVSLRWDIIKLMMDLRDRFGLTYVFITHNLALARYISARIAVMYLGKIVELGPTETVIRNPLHPYTRALISVVPSLRRKREKVILRGEVPNPIDLPPGCRFHPRCPGAIDRCAKEEPELTEIEHEHYVRCLLYAKN